MQVNAALTRTGKLPQTILSRAFDGELVPTEAALARAEGRNYKAAEEMLERSRGKREEVVSARKPGKARTPARKRARAAEASG